MPVCDVVSDVSTQIIPTQQATMGDKNRATVHIKIEEKISLARSDMKSTFSLVSTIFLVRPTIKFRLNVAYASFQNNGIRTILVTKSQYKEYKIYIPVTYSSSLCGMIDGSELPHFCY